MKIVISRKFSELNTNALYDEKYQDTSGFRRFEIFKRILMGFRECKVHVSPNIFQGTLYQGSKLWDHQQMG